MSEMSHEGAAILLAFQVIISALDKKGLVPKEEMEAAFNFRLQTEVIKEGPPIFSDVLEIMARSCRTKKSDSESFLTLVKNNPSDTEPDK